MTQRQYVAGRLYMGGAAVRGLAALRVRATHRGWAARQGGRVARRAGRNFLVRWLYLGERLYAAWRLFVSAPHVVARRLAGLSGHLFQGGWAGAPGLHEVAPSAGAAVSDGSRFRRRCRRRRDLYYACASLLRCGGAWSLCCTLHINGEGWFYKIFVEQ